MVGDQFLYESLRLTVFASERPAVVKPVTRVEPTEGFLAIPRNMAPASDNPIEYMRKRFSVCMVVAWLPSRRRTGGYAVP